METPYADGKAGALLGRGGYKHFAFAAGLWLGFGFRSFLLFFAAFIFASHGSKHTQLGRIAGRETVHPTPLSG